MTSLLEQQVFRLHEVDLGESNETANSDGSRAHGWSCQTFVPMIIGRHWNKTQGLVIAEVLALVEQQS